MYVRSRVPIVRQSIINAISPILNRRSLNCYEMCTWHACGMCYLQPTAVRFDRICIRRMRSNTYRSRISCSTVRGQRRHQRSGDVDMAPWCRWSFRQSSDKHTCHTGQRIRWCSGDIPSQTTCQYDVMLLKLCWRC